MSETPSRSPPWARISQFPRCRPQTMKGFAPAAALSKSSAGSKTMRPLSVSPLMRKLSAKVRPRFSHIAAAIAFRSCGDFSGKARARLASARFCRPRRGAISRQSFPDSQDAACKGIARARATASQKAANSRQSRNSLGYFMRRGRPRNDGRQRPHANALFLRAILRKWGDARVASMSARQIARRRSSPVAERVGVAVQGRRAAKMRVEHFRALREKALTRKIDEALHRLPLVDGIGDHAFEPRGEPYRVLGFFRRHAVSRIGVVLDKHDVVVRDLLTKFDELCGVARDIEDLRLRLLGRERAVDADHIALPPVLLKADDHAGLGGAGHGAHDDVIEFEPKLALLVA